jgi:hypothetical protein
VDKGTFTELTTLTIPEGELEVAADVFWPVIRGAPVVYQCSEKVRVEAQCCWQPLFHTVQHAGTGTRSHGTAGAIEWNRMQGDVVIPSNYGDPLGYPDILVVWPRRAGAFPIDPSACCLTKGLRHTNYFDLARYLYTDIPESTSTVQFQASAIAYNEMEAALNLL